MTLIAVIDNALPFSQGNPSRQGHFTQTELEAAVQNPEMWDDESLLSLLKDLLRNLTNTTINGYALPELFLKSVEKGLDRASTFVLLDWETGTKDPEARLRDIALRLPESPIFIITGYDQARDIETIVKGLDGVGSRIEVFEKNNGDFSLVQLLSRLNEAIAQCHVVFKEGGKVNPDPRAVQKLPQGYKEIYFITNRNYLGAGNDGYYGSDEDNKLNFGSANVVSPVKPVPNTIANLWGYRTTKDKVVQMNVLSEHMFWSKIEKERSLLRAAFVYVHGFATTFEEALLALNRLSIAARIDGPIILFSWPSLGKKSAKAYRTDKERAINSEVALKEMLRMLMAQGSGKNISVMAYSMGNFLLTSSLGLLAESNSSAMKKNLSEIILAAADVPPAHLQQHQMSFLPASRTTVYISSNDKALMLSNKYQTHHRVGYVPPPFMSDHFDTIDVSDAKTPFFGAGHDYPHKARIVISDLSQVLSHTAIEKRANLEQPLKGGKRHWKLLCA